MGRLFTKDGSTNDSVKVAAQGLTAFPFGTMMSCCYYSGAFDGAKGHNLIVIGTDAQDQSELFLNAAPNAEVQWYNGSTDSKDAGTATFSDKWEIVGFTKTTGTTTARAHSFRFDTAAWSHTDFDATLADASGTGATEHGVGFNTAGLEGYCWNGHVLTVAVWKSRVLTDSEVERLARGLWDLSGPDMLLEFPSGRDNLTRTTIDCSRNRMRQTVSGSQVTRTNIAGPPGFRLSALNRRR